jgi:cold shock CspA family protein
MDDMMAYVDENGMITDTPPDPNKKKKVIKAENIEISIPKSEAVSMTDSVRKGTVSFYNDSKGFGFIVDSETKESIFMHVNNIEGDIKENNVVSFEVEMGPKGPNAINVKQSK